MGSTRFFVVLAAVDKDLRNSKENLFRTKELLLKSFQKKDADLAQRRMLYKDNYKDEDVNVDEVFKRAGEA